jgi:hypothetical protein
MSTRLPASAGPPQWNRLDTVLSVSVLETRIYLVRTTPVLPRAWGLAAVARASFSADHGTGTLKCFRQ